MHTKHTFHIPVMGTGFTLDTPLKVSPYGMDSVVSIVDDVLIENLRKTYCEKFEIPYQAITNKIEDFRAKRITSYLNLMQELAEKKFKQIKDSTMETGQEIKTYFNMLPDTSAIKQKFTELTSGKHYLDRDPKLGRPASYHGEHRCEHHDESWIRSTIRRVNH